ncbi:MAG: hypothetical protein J3K34DRAFT_498243 [Monoraphidium minutum]|nr:MAG: hypothetical protein J3K34DRAFT_498243 [Monoraphidium minutum]
MDQDTAQNDLHSAVACFAVTLPGGAPPAAVALGTGTKCLGGGAQRGAAAGGELLLDGHAEVIARRALMAWLYDQLEAACQGEAGGGPPRCACGSCAQAAAFAWCPHVRRFAAAPGLRVHMYISQPPCGDGSIFASAGGGDSGVSGGPQGQQDQEQQEQQQAQKQQQEQRPSGAPTASGALPSAAPGAERPAFGRTGAKLIRLNGADSDAAQAPAPAVPQEGDVERGAQAPGALRRKPGRGDATLSMSCSDKLARWGCVGVQGALLAALLGGPLYLDTLTAAVARAVAGRTRAAACERLRPPFAWRPPAVTLSASGRKAGSARGPVSLATRSRLCGAELAARFARLSAQAAGLATGAGSGSSGDSFGGGAALSPAALKAALKVEGAAGAAAAEGGGEGLLQTYAEAWRELRRPPSVFAAWLSKPLVGGPACCNAPG